MELSMKRQSERIPSPFANPNYPTSNVHACPFARPGGNRCYRRMSIKINPAGLGPLHALVVEDNEHMRILIRTVLKAFGMREIHECKSGADALSYLATNKPDFIITDLAMAPMDGLQFTRAVRELPNRAECVVPIIMLTGYTERRRVEAARDAGVTEILAKPVTPAGIFQR